MYRKWIKAAAVAAVLTGVLGAVPDMALADSAPDGPIVFKTGTGPIQSGYIAAQLLAWTTGQDLMPQGVNDPNCKPSAAHPYPTIVIPGSIGSSYSFFSRLIPAIEQDGTCVYSFNTGDLNLGSLPLHQMGSPYDYANELAKAVKQVLAHTGAAKVNIVGYSQSTVEPLYYIKYLGGQDTVHQYVGYNGTPQGLDFFGALSLLESLTGLSGENIGLYKLAPVAEAYDPKGPFVQDVARGGFTVPGVQYTTINTANITLVVPGQGTLPAAANVTNINVNQSCPIDLASHTGIIYDDISLRVLLNTLDPAHAAPVPCYPVLPTLPF